MKRTIPAFFFGFLLAAPRVGTSFESPRENITKLVSQIQWADYAGDRAALRRLYQELAPYAGDEKLGAQVWYWRGFAFWRRALNGFNESAEPVELERDLTDAVTAFDEATAKDPSFVDAKVGAGFSLFNLMFLNRQDPARVGEILARAVPLLKAAEAAEPENPRLLWVLGANRWYAPPERGGGHDKAIETYERGLRAARAPKSAADDPLQPSWGEPELLMNLAWSKLNATEPDLAAAEEYARAALALVPHWHYVKDILIPQIASAKANP